MSTPQTQAILDAILERDGELTDRNAPHELVKLAKRLEKDRSAIQSLAAIANDLAAWSDRWPRKALYSATTDHDKMDAELIELENRAKSAVAIFNA